MFEAFTILSGVLFWFHLRAEYYFDISTIVGIICIRILGVNYEYEVYIPIICKLYK